MVLALRDQGVDVTVIHKDSSNLFAPDNSPRWEPLHSRAISVDQGPRQSFFSSLLGAFRFRTPAYARWIQPAIEKAVHLHQEKPFDLIYSRSLPFFAHVAGYWMKRKLNLPWIANVNDPWDLHLFPDDRAQRVSKLYAMGSNYWLRRSEERRGG